MSLIVKISRAIDALTGFFGRYVSWFVLAAVLVSAANAISRKAFNVSSNAWLELQWYFFGAVFMLTAADALRRNAHVRIDILTSLLTKKTRDVIDLVCHILFLLPFCLLMSWLSWSFFLRAAKSGEMSSNFGGLIIWPARFLILLGFILLLLQGVSEIIKRIAVLKGSIKDTQRDGGLDLS
ncbi:TRAP transporter small permease subunit [Roseovarius aestuarii]|nr:TRAP transporter small permease subunit [Roseovarius aestuarii]